MEENQMLTKKCSQCGIEKPLSEFHKNSNFVDGVQRICKECVRENNKTYRERKKEETLHKVYGNPDLAMFQPRELIAELKARGYTGELQYTQRITV